MLYVFLLDIFFVVGCYVKLCYVSLRGKYFFALKYMLLFVTTKGILHHDVEHYP